MEINKEKIAELVIERNYGFFQAFPDVILKIDEAIQWAWDNWDKDLISPYCQFEKPEIPTKEFIVDWIENEDFEADGFNMDEIKAI